jgi:hypothetical protein
VALVAVQTAHLRAVQVQDNRRDAHRGGRRGPEITEAVAPVIPAGTPDAQAGIDRVTAVTSEPAARVAANAAMAANKAAASARILKDALNRAHLLAPQGRRNLSGRRNDWKTGILIQADA